MWRYLPPKYTPVGLDDGEEARLREYLTLRKMITPVVIQVTLLRSRFEARANGWFKLIFPLFVILLRRTEKKTVQYAKQYVESRRAATAGSDSPSPAPFPGR